MSITPGGIHDQYTRIRANCFGEGFGTLFDDDVTPANGAREGGIEGRSIGILAVSELRNNDFGLETRFALQCHV